MSYGVFRLNGRSGTGLIMVATFEEESLCLSDRLWTAEAFRLDERIVLSEEMGITKPTIARLSLCESVKAGEDLTGFVRHPETNTFFLGDLVRADKAPRPIRFVQEVNLVDMFEYFVQHPADTLLQFRDILELAKTPAPGGFTCMISPCDTVEFHLQYPSDENTYLEDRVESSKMISPRGFMEVISVGEHLDIYVQKHLESLSRLSDKVEGTVFPCPEILYERMRLAMNVEIQSPIYPEAESLSATDDLSSERTKISEIMMQEESSATERLSGMEIPIPKNQTEDMRVESGLDLLFHRRSADGVSLMELPTVERIPSPANKPEKLRLADIPEAILHRRAADEPELMDVTECTNLKQKNEQIEEINFGEQVEAFTE